MRTKDERCGAEGEGPRLRLFDEIRRVLRVKHYSRRTEATYVGWIRRFVRFHWPRHPRELGKEGIERFLSSLAVGHDVSAATQNQTLAALVFLHQGLDREGLGRGHPRFKGRGGIGSGARKTWVSSIRDPTGRKRAYGAGLAHAGVLADPTRPAPDHARSARWERDPLPYEGLAVAGEGEEREVLRVAVVAQVEDVREAGAGEVVLRPAPDLVGVLDEPRRRAPRGLR